MRRHKLVVVDEGHFLAVSLMNSFDGRRRLQRPAELQGLGSIEQLDGQHTLRVEHHLIQFCGRIGTPTDMIFLPLRRRNAVYR